MKIIKQAALVTGQEVFSLVAIHTIQNPQMWENWIGYNEIVPIPQDLPYIKSGWNYSNGVFTATENANDPLLKDEEMGNAGFALVKDGVVFDSIYPDTNTEIGQRLFAGLSTSPKIVEVPEDVFVLVGDTWDGTEFKKKDS